MTWYKIALEWNDPGQNTEHEIYQDVMGRSGKEISDLVEQNYDMLYEEAQRKLEAGIDIENVVEEMTKEFGRNFGFSPKRTLEWSTLWSEIFEIVQSLSPEQGKDWTIMEFEDPE